MLVSLSVANFRSFASEQVFSLIGSKRPGATHPDHLLRFVGCDPGVLRASVIYGANGSGRSNLHKALSYTREIALAARNNVRGTGRNPFRLPNMSEQPSTFDLQFVKNGRLYRFGFSVDDQRILQEWLVQIVGNTEKLIYERRATADGRTELTAPGLQHAGANLAALLARGAPVNQSFLATVRWILHPKDFGETLSEAIEWLEQDLTLLGPDSTPGMLAAHLAANQDFREFAGSFLNACATGIDRITVDKRELKPEELAALVPDCLMSLIRSHGEQREAAVVLPDGADLVIERTAAGERFQRVAIQTTHRQGTPHETTLELSEESDGTRRLLELMPALYQMRRGSAVLFIDEIDRSMHPMLVYKFIEYFLTCTAGPCQIILTTHETHLLTLELLRRDEIWFAEKDRSGATNLYSLADFKLHKRLRTHNGFLDGRFGAVPFMGDISRLLESRPETAVCH